MCNFQVIVHNLKSNIVLNQWRPWFLPCAVQLLRPSRRATRLKTSCARSHIAWSDQLQINKFVFFPPFLPFVTLCLQFLLVFFVVPSFAFNPSTADHFRSWSKDLLKLHTYATLPLPLLSSPEPPHVYDLFSLFLFPTRSISENTTNRRTLSLFVRLPSATTTTTTGFAFYDNVKLRTFLHSPSPTDPHRNLVFVLSRLTLLCVLCIYYDHVASTDRVSARAKKRWRTKRLPRKERTITKKKMRKRNNRFSSWPWLLLLRCRFWCRCYRKRCTCSTKLVFSSPRSSSPPSVLAIHLILRAVNTITERGGSRVGGETPEGTHRLLMMMILFHFTTFARTQGKRLGSFDSCWHGGRRLWRFALPQRFEESLKIRIFGDRR